MKTSDFYYDLPEELIAQDPLEDRSSSRLMVLDRESGNISHHIFKDIIDYLNRFLRTIIKLVVLFFCLSLLTESNHSLMITSQA